jgi:hypothetical protein
MPLISVFKVNGINKQGWSPFVLAIISLLLYIMFCVLFFFFIHHSYNDDRMYFLSGRVDRNI